MPRLCIGGGGDAAAVNGGGGGACRGCVWGGGGWVARLCMGGGGGNAVFRGECCVSLGGLPRLCMGGGSCVWWGMLCLGGDAAAVYRGGGGDAAAVYRGMLCNGAMLRNGGMLCIRGHAAAVYFHPAIASSAEIPCPALKEQD